MEPTFEGQIHTRINVRSQGRSDVYTDITGCQRALFEWADSYDTKDWERLRRCAAPSLRVDYRAFVDLFREDMPIDEFVAMASSPSFLGNPLIKTQHFIGLSKWDKVSEDEILGTHQVRVPHQKYTDDTFTNIAVKGHAHGTGTMWYKKVDGVWKFGGLCPHIRWSEFDYDAIFKESEELPN